VLAQDIWPHISAVCSFAGSQAPYHLLRPRQALPQSLSVGFVSVLGAVLLIPTSLIAATFGAQLANLLPKKTLELAFAAYIAVISARFAVELVWA
jgi:hypothetical protein